MQMSKQETKKTKKNPYFVSFTQENADTFPFLICRDHNRHGQTGATCCERKDPTSYLISLLVEFIKDLDFRRITSKFENGTENESISRINDSLMC